MRGRAGTATRRLEDSSMIKGGRGDEKAEALFDVTESEGAIGRAALFL
jgi:hypothetical protein